MLQTFSPRSKSLTFWHKAYHFVPCWQKSLASPTCELFLSQSLRRHDPPLLHLLSLSLPSSFIPRLSVCLRCGLHRGRITNPDRSSREDCWRESADRYCRASAECFAFAQKIRIAAVPTDAVVVLQNNGSFIWKNSVMCCGAGRALHQNVKFSFHREISPI